MFKTSLLAFEALIVGQCDLALICPKSLGVIDLVSLRTEFYNCECFSSLETSIFQSHEFQLLLLFEIESQFFTSAQVSPYKLTISSYSLTLPCLIVLGEKCTTYKIFL